MPIRYLRQKESVELFPKVIRGDSISPTREFLAGSLMPIRYLRQKESVELFPKVICGDSISPTK
jgi:hypothetical protein